MARVGQVPFNIRADLTITRNNEKFVPNRIRPLLEKIDALEKQTPASGSCTGCGLRGKQNGIRPTN